MNEAISPAAAVGPGRFDPHALLLVWCARKAFWGALWLGLAVAAITNQLDKVSSDFDTLASGLLSPLILLWIALGLRLGAAMAAYALAYPIARQQQHGFAYRAGLMRLVDLAIDQWQLTRALSSFRWTYPVRAAAVKRAGTAGRLLAVSGFVINILNNLLLVALVVVLVAHS